MGFGGPGEIRTLDLFHAMEARSQLRHRPVAMFLRPENSISAYQDWGGANDKIVLAFFPASLLTLAWIEGTIRRSEDPVLVLESGIAILDGRNRKSLFRFQARW